MSAVVQCADTVMGVLARDLRAAAGRWVACVSGIVKFGRDFEWSGWKLGLSTLVCRAVTDGADRESVPWALSVRFVVDV